MSKKVSLFFILFYFLQVLPTQAEPSPFGIVINKTTVGEVKKKYEYKEDGINQFSGGVMLRLNPAQFNFEGLQYVNIIFGKDDKVLAVVTVFDKNRYKDLYNNLSKKYSINIEDNPFVGDKFTQFKDKNSTIMLFAKHLNFVCELHYMQEDYYNSLSDKKNEKQQKLSQEKEKL
jgi:hypothetical protein